MAVKKQKQIKKITKPIKKDVEISLSELFRVLVDGYGKNKSRIKQKYFSNLLQKYLKQEVAKHSCSKGYNVLILFDNTILVKSDSDKIYEAVTKFDNKKPLLLVLLSGGGDLNSAYLIGKLCSEFCNKRFITTIPRYAKSAATLLACAADEIHMGSMSELGPIDPQIKSKSSSARMPALGLKNSIEHIADLVRRYPTSTAMFAQYLNLSVEPVQIGYYERVAESAVQYAEKLLNTHAEKLANPPSDIANRLVYDYKDHGFVIDKIEATDIFGKDIVKCNTKEYDLSNTIYNILTEIEEMATILNHSFYFIGSLNSYPNFYQRNRRES